MLTCGRLSRCGLLTLPYHILDADMAEQAELTHVGDNNEKPFWKQYTLFHAAWAQFCYTGAQGKPSSRLPLSVVPVYYLRV